jgi:hypothetical protein
MKTLFVAVLCSCATALAACGGGSSGSNTGPLPPAKATSATTATFRFTIPLPTTIATAHARTPQYVAPNTSFFLVDLQGNSDPQFQNTFIVDSGHCATNAGTGSYSCTFTGVVPAGDPTTQRWSIATGAGKPDGTSGPPLSVLHNVAPCSSFSGSPSCTNGQVNLSASLDAVVVNVVGPFGSAPFLDFQPINPGLVPPGSPVPLFQFVGIDAFGNSVSGAFTADAPFGNWGFTNPITIAEDDTSGEIFMEVLQHVAGGVLPLGPVTTATFSTLAGLHGGVAGIQIDDNATASRTVHFTYSVPEVALQPSEFPQLAGIWHGPAKNATLLTITCVPPASVPAGTNPCSQVFSQ